MAAIKDKVQNALDETRMLVLGSQVLLGFQLKSSFEEAFDTLPATHQYLKTGGLIALVVTTTLLMAPAAYHQIAERGDATERIHDYATRLASCALLPFALALGVDVFVGGARIGGDALGLALGVGLAALALFMWYGLEMLRRRSHPRHRDEDDMHDRGSDEGTALRDKIKEVLTEARVVLPGAQALLGFQLIAIMMSSFERQARWLQYTHLACLSLVAIATILLMTPAAYHRLVERGENSDHFHRFAGRMLISAMVVLPLGICGDVFVVVYKVTHDSRIAAAIAAALLAFCFGLWFAYSAYARRRRDASADGEPDAERPLAA